MKKHGRVSIPDVIKATRFTVSEIYALFPNKKALLAFFYPALAFQYRIMIKEIDDFENYSIGEKLSNFIYTSFDIMQEKVRFVENTFNELAYANNLRENFHEEVTVLFKEFLTSDGNIATSIAFFMNQFFYKLLAYRYLAQVKYWLADSSDNKERSLALTDKLTGLFEELVYNKTIDKSIDLARFWWESIRFEKYIPDIGFRERDEITIEITNEDNDQPSQHESDNE